MSRFQIRDLLDEDKDAIAAFRCRERSLAHWLRKWGYYNDRNGISAVTVCRKSESAARELPDLLGYYSASAASLPAEQLRAFVPADYPSPTIGLPVMLVGRLAVHRDAEGHGVGTVLFRHALQSSLTSRIVIGVVVEAISDEAAVWYERFGLRRLGGSDLRLFILVSDTRRILAL